MVKSVQGIMVTAAVKRIPQLVSLKLTSRIRKRIKLTLFFMNQAVKFALIGG
jgi:hypothetical protein